MTTHRSTVPADLLTRLGAVADRGTLRITTRGRKTGKPHTVTIWFVVDGQTIFLGTLDAGRDWVRNVQKSPDVTLEVEGLRLRGNATAIADVALEGRVRDLLAQKYWMAWIGSWFGMGPARTFRVDDVEVS
jgi:deazaflavin-dependent oxidoreductase (nitroreductase family)